MTHYQFLIHVDMQMLRETVLRYGLKRSPISNIHTQHQNAFCRLLKCQNVENFIFLSMAMFKMIVGLGSCHTWAKKFRIFIEITLSRTLDRDDHAMRGGA